MGAPPGALPWRVRCMAGDLFLRYGRRLLGGILTGFDRDYQAISRAYWCLTQSALNAHSGYAHKRFKMYAAFSNRLLARSLPGSARRDLLCPRTDPDRRVVRTRL
jgi:hypothetical protein